MTQRERSLISPFAVRSAAMKVIYSRKFMHLPLGKRRQRVFPLIVHTFARFYGNGIRAIVLNEKLAINDDYILGRFCAASYYFLRTIYSHEEMSHAATGRESARDPLYDSTKLRSAATEGLDVPAD